MPLSLTQNALFMVGIHGKNILITHKARVTSHVVEPTTINLILGDVDEAKEAFLILVVATAAVAMTTVGCWSVCFSDENSNFT
jgi:hypothetical protein